LILSLHLPLHAGRKVKTCRQDAGVPTAPIACHWFRNAAFQAAGVAVAFDFAVAFAFAVRWKQGPSGP
jgi:hypothetical protein